MRKLAFLSLGLAISCGGSAFNAGGAAGSSAGGSSSAGTSATGGTGSSAGSTGYGGESGNAGSPGQAGSASGGSATGGSATGGSATGGSAGSTSMGGASGSGGSGGSAGASCTELIARAQKELAAARECNPAVDSIQCTGKVATTCGCEVPVENADGPRTKTYLATLAEIHQRSCVQKCPAIACSPVINPQCSVNPDGALGTCTNIIK